MAFKEGDMLLVEYSLFVKETGELVETSREDIAKLYKKYEEGRDYGPELFIVGEGRYVKGIEEALKNAAELNKDYEVEIPPDKAYGERDPSKIKVYSRKVFLKNNIVPEVGKEVTIGNSTGRIVALSGGRVTVDFNHPLAGKTLIFKFKIVKRLEDLGEKIKHLIRRRVKRLNMDEVKVNFDSEKGVVEVELPKDMRVADGVNILKYLVAKDILRWIDGVNEVIFVDRYDKQDFKGSSGGGEV